MSDPLSRSWPQTAVKMSSFRVHQKSYTVSVHDVELQLLCGSHAGLTDVSGKSVKAKNG